MNSVTHIILLLLTLLPLHQAQYSPSDSILLDCGSNQNGTDIDRRTWMGESLAKVILSSSNSQPTKAAFQDPSLPSPIPYMTANIFTSVSTYKFNVNKQDRHWVRLHFYPAAYNSLNSENCYFDVSASGGITLLKNFSAYITAQALTQAYIVKEFSLTPSDDGTLSLTFTPSKDYQGSYAFINGIEIISMPNIYSKPATLVGFSDTQIDVGASAFQTMYRVNVGGQYIPPSNDSVSRTWYDDTPYIYGAGFGVTFGADDKFKIQYPDEDSKFAAPEDVYKTARMMGPDSKITLNFNLTWVFQVDANFTYMVRLHMCELQLSKVNQRVFDIFINNQTAQSAADVIGWSSSKGAPVYKDYTVAVNDGPGDEMLWVALHPNEAMKPEYMDAIMNGLEIFKLSDTNGNLAGANPVPSPLMLQAEFGSGPTEFQEGSTNKTHIVAGVTLGGALFIGLAFAIFAFVYKKKKTVDSSDSKSGWLPLYGNSQTSGSKSTTMSGKSCSSSHVSIMAASLCRHFSIDEIRKGTKNFDESLVIGVGGFGKVYKGIVDGSTKVAVKRSNPSSEQGVHEFQTEIEMLSKLRHRHLVSLIGYCEEEGEMCLVYDFMAHGTLREHVYNTKKAPLSWKQRLEICIGAARGLHYLHTGAKYTIIHRDVKTTNILLDEKWVAKVSDFGLSKTGPTMNQGHVSTVVKGSFGYLDPEYFRRQQLTDKSDVYSFGVVLFEVICARAALNPSLPKEQVSLADWALNCQRKGTIGDIIDPLLKGRIDPECLKKFTETAEKCLSDHGADRPTMGDVLWNLEFALQLQENADDGGSSKKNASVDMSQSERGESNSGAHNRTGSVSGSEVNNDPDSMNSNGIFSQLVSPKGR